MSLNHILPKEYTETLKVLQDRCLNRTSDEIEQIFHEEFGKSQSELFQSLEEEPIAAASLAQVVINLWLIKANFITIYKIMAGFPWCHKRREEGSS